MKIYGEINDNLSEKEKVEALNRYRNLQGWFDKLWEQVDFRGYQKDALLAGNAVTAEGEDCSARYQLTMHGDLLVVLVKNGRTKCFVIDRLSGERKVDFYVGKCFSL